MTIGGSLEAWLQAMKVFPTPLWACDAAGRLLLWNDALAAMTGREGAIGQAPGPALKLRQAFALNESDNPLLAEAPGSWVDAGLSLEGAEDLIPVDVWAVPLRAATGETLGAMAVVQQTAREALYRKAIVGFQRTVGHDIRNAVSVLEGYLPLLLASCGKPDAARPIIETLGRASQLLQGITTLMMNNARMTDALQPVSNERYLLRELVLEATRTLAPAAYNKDVRIESDVDEDVLVRGARDLLIVALTNMLYAAVKFARNRSEVRIGATIGDAVTGTIQFNCRAIPAADVERLFSAVSEPEDPRLGTGLALFMGRRLLRHHGCDVTLESPSDGTSIFRFTLPAAQ